MYHNHTYSISKVALFFRIMWLVVIETPPRECKTLPSFMYIRLLTGHYVYVCMCIRLYVVCCTKFLLYLVVKPSACPTTAKHYATSHVITTLPFVKPFPGVIHDFWLLRYGPLGGL